MPSAVSTQTFPNKKPKAVLTGSATMAESTTASNTDINAGFTFDSRGELSIFSPGTNKLSQTITTPSNSLVVVAASAVIDSQSTGNYLIRVLDGTTILKTTTVNIIDGTARTISVLFVGVPLSGSRTYNVQSWTTSAGGGLLGFITIDISHVQLTDTHAASSKNKNIISG